MPGQANYPYSISTVSQAFCRSVAKTKCTGKAADTPQLLVLVFADSALRTRFANETQTAHNIDIPAHMRARAHTKNYWPTLKKSGRGRG